MKDYRAYLMGKGFFTHTVDSHLFAIRQMRERIGEEPTSEDLLNHKDWLAAHFAAKTVNLRVTAINSYLDYIGHSGIRLKGLRIQQKPYLDNVISQADYELLRDSLLRDGELFWHFVVRFLACTGARVSELRQFTVESVRDGHLDIVSKGHKLRRIYIPTSLQCDAARWLDEIGRRNGYVFSSKNGNPMTTRGISMGLKRLRQSTASTRMSSTRTRLGTVSRRTSSRGTRTSHFSPTSWATRTSRPRASTCGVLPRSSARQSTRLLTGDTFAGFYTSDYAYLLYEWRNRHKRFTELQSRYFLECRP